MSAYTNIYELLDQEGEEGVPRVAPVKKDTPVAKSAPAKGASSAPVKSAQQSTFNKNQNPKNNQGRGERSEGRGGLRQDNRPPRQQREGGFNNDRNYNNSAPRSSGFGGEGETPLQPVEFSRRDRPADRQQARDTGNTRHDDARRGVPAGGFVGSKRVYDRKSGTGRGNSVGREDKRRGGGRHNWGANDGSDSVEIAAEETGTAVDGEAAPSTDAVHGGEKAEEVETEEQKAKREEKEKEDKLLSWSDYQKQREAKRAQSSVLSQGLAIRKANEGVDEKLTKKWNSMEQVKKDEAPAAATTATPAATATKTEGESQKKDKKGKSVRLDELFNVTVKESAPRPQYDDDRRGGRGGRGRGDSGFRGGRGGQRGDRAPRQDRNQSRGAEVNFDPNSFPTLQ